MEPKQYTQNYKEDFDYRQGMSYYKTRKYEDAKKCFIKSINNKTEYLSKSIFFLGKIYVIQGKKEKAEEKFKEYIEIDKDRNQQGRLELGILYESQGKEKEAEEQFYKCIEIDKDKTPHARLELGILYRSQGKEKEAEEQFKKCNEIKNNKNNININYKNITEIKNIFEKQVIEKEGDNLSKIRAKIYVGTISNEDLNILEKSKEELTTEQYYLIKIAIYEKLGQKRNALEIIKEIEKAGIKIRELANIKERLKSKKRRMFDLDKWDNLIGWNVSNTKDYDEEKRKLKELQEKVNVKIKEEKEIVKQPKKVEIIDAKDAPKAKENQQLSKKIVNKKTVENTKSEELTVTNNKQNIKSEQAPSSKNEKIQNINKNEIKKIKDNLSKRVISEINEIKKDYYVKMQYAETTANYMKKYDKLERILESDSTNKRMKLELMLVLINEGYRQLVKEEFQEEDYKFLDELIKQYYQKKVKAKEAIKDIDEYCL